MKHRPWRKTGYQITTLIAAAVLLLILFVTGGYFFTLDPRADAVDRELLRSRFESNRALWQSRRPAAFDYVVERECFCNAEFQRPYLVREKDDRRTAVYASPLAGADDRPAAAPPEPFWLDDIFVLIEDAIRNADGITVIYDPAFGFPTSVTIDWSVQTTNDEQHYQVRDFQVSVYRE